MLILTIRTDKPEAELGLYEDDVQLAYTVWEAHRQLAETIHQQIEQLLESKSKNLNDLEAIIVYKGPGSFTGLRIGASVANALADGLALPIVGETTDDWVHQGCIRLQSKQEDHVVIPEYGSEPHITTPRK